MKFPNITYRFCQCGLRDEEPNQKEKQRGGKAKADGEK
jgi:hypothetical protein